MSEIYEAQIAGKAIEGSFPNGSSRWLVDYAGSCTSPLPVKANADKGSLFALFAVRCRKCPACLRARTNYWGYAAMRETLETQEKGLRTWFGTLTLSPEWQREMQRRALERWMESSPSSEPPSWFDDMKCDEQFRLVRNEILHEVQKFWKRLRKAGHHFKYFVVFERHKSGLPHMHFLLHEQEAPIRKRDIQKEWSFGHSNVSIVGGNGARAAAPEKAAWYVAKYLSKSYQSRQLASRGYKPHKGERGNVSPKSPPKG